MKNNNTNNTKKRGVARTLIFKRGKVYKAVCLDFDLIEEAKTREEAEKQIRDSVVGYIENICNNNLDDSLLNRHAEKKYWEMYNEYLQIISNEKLKMQQVDRKPLETSIFTTPINSRELCLS